LGNVKVLIADDHAVMRTGIRQVLGDASGIEVVGEAGNGRELLAALRETQADVILMDMVMPGISGIDLIKRVRAEAPAVAILVHTMFTDGQLATRALRAGAKGYVTKGSPVEQLIDALSAVSGGRRYISADIVDEVLESMTSAGGGSPHDLLSDRELQIFHKLIEGKSISDIAEGLHLSPKTVSTYKARLMEKLHASSSTELVRYAITHGLMQIPGGVEHGDNLEHGSRSGRSASPA
jgi:DNA-binding NarL/FixJ family response regulator